MPRRSSKLRKFITGAGSGALTAAPTANPYLIGGAAIAGGALNAVQSDSQFNPQPYRSALRRLRRSGMRRARRTADEAGSQLGSSLAARGLGDSGLGVGIIEGNRQRAFQQAEDRYSDLEAQVELEIADAQAIQQRQSADAFNREITALGLQGAGFLQTLGNPQPTDNPALRKIRDAFGIPNAEPFDINSFLGGGTQHNESYIDLGAGFSVRRDSPIGQIANTSTEFARQMLEALGAGR